jgi:probable F420-dependent oxidoreductase
MNVGLIPASDGQFPVAGAHVADLARATESAGFDSIWIGEHVVMPVEQKQEYPGASRNRIGPRDTGVLPDPLEWLSYVAAVTDHLLLGTAIMLLPLHNPLVIAKRLSTLDQLSSGRVRLGVGLGWSEAEYEAVGESFATRGSRCDEMIRAMRAVWSESPVRFDGTLVRFDDVHSFPQPVGQRVPILIGGDSEAAARRAGRLGDGYLPFEKDHARLSVLLATMRRSAEQAGRDPATIELTGLGSRNRQSVERLREMGFSRVLLFLPDLTTHEVERLGREAAALVEGL